MASLRAGQGKDKIIHSTYDALVPVQISHEDPKRELPDDDEVTRQTEQTKKALGLLVNDKIAAAQTSRVTKQSDEPTYVGPALVRLVDGVLVTASNYLVRVVLGSCNS